MFAFLFHFTEAKEFGLLNGSVVHFLFAMICKHSLCSERLCVRSIWRVSTNILIAVRGVLSSWVMFPTKVD